MAQAATLARPGAWDVHVEADGVASYRRYMAWLPAIWLTGTAILVAVYLSFRMAATRWPEDAKTNLVVGTWLLATLAQASSVAWNWSLGEYGGAFLASRLLSTTTIGWLLAGVAIAAGRGWDMSSPRALRASMVLGLHVAWVGTLAMVVAIALGIQQLHLPTPVSVVLGQGSAISFYTTAQLVNPEESSFGLPRLILFFPWPTCLSLAGICLAVLSTCERDARWRAAGFAGAFVAVAFSFSRAGYAILILALMATYAFRMPRGGLAVLLLCGAAVGIACALLGTHPVAIFNEMVSAMRESRAGSSMARDQIYQASWEGFLASPVFGWGWVGDSVISQEMIPVGSHSTLYGTLYTGGLVTFLSVAFAGFATLIACGHQAFRTRTREAGAAFGLMVAIVSFSYGEAMYSLIPALTFAFMFVGGGLGARAEGATETAP